MEKVNIYGLGYIGLPTASLLASKGYQVLGIDVSKDVVETINAGRIHIVEPDLAQLVYSVVHSHKLTASLTPQIADVHILAVPTPCKADHQPDLSYVKSAVHDMCQVLKNSDLVILESTSPVGTSEYVQEVIQQECPDLTNVAIAYSPERVIPGKVLQELVENDRVIGGIDEHSTQRAVAFYKTFVDGQVLSTNARTAEMCKLAENAFRDVNIAFANELSLICEHLHINVWELVKLANRHPRVNILQPGPGVGGHCIAVDPWFIVSAAKQQSKLIQQARAINDSRPQWVVDQVKQAMKHFKNPVIACMGVSFKADIDDLRESPALKIAEQLKQEKLGNILVCEPNINHLEGFTLVDCPTAIKQADIILFLVNHQPFKQLSQRDLQDKYVLDIKGVLEP